MIMTGIKGLNKLKQMINEMSNQTLISEWHTILYYNGNCSPINDQQCIKCDLASCIGYLTYEEIITNELMDRGLFDLAMNICYRKMSANIQNISTIEFRQFYS